MSTPLSTIVTLDQADALDAALTGGKGANLAVLTQAGFPVPPAFIATTAAYHAFIQAGGLQPRLEALMAALDYSQADEVERVAAQARSLIMDAAMPAAVHAALAAAHGALGKDSFVAVRSSGTAEDLAEASFAGLHDTYLDIRGADAVMGAVKRCWASMWTARAVSYRQTKGIDHGTARIAVVVQVMVASEVSGVLFTVDPMTAATDEIVINSSWGLGEGIVSGITEPDYYRLRSGDLSIRERTLGSKQLRVVRDPKTGVGTVTETVADAERAQWTLSGDLLFAVGDLGRHVVAHFDGLPQDVEWAVAQGRVYLLQSRPVTGVDVSWDSELDRWQTLPDRDDIVWTRSWSDEQWTGAITPLFYSWRADMFTRAYTRCAKIWGVPEMLSGRLFKYYKGEAYFSADLEKAILEHTVFPVLRHGPNALNHVPPTWHKEVLNSPFSILRYLKMHGRMVAAHEPANTPYAFLRTFDNYFNARSREADGLAAEEIRKLSDAALEAYVERCIGFEIEFAEDLWAGYYFYARDAFGALGWMVANWYDGGNPLALGEMLTGTPKRTSTVIETLELWRLCEVIRHSPRLRALFDQHPDASFFDALARSEEGQTFLAEYQAFAKANSHRGHAERDIYFPRREEDPGLDYRAWKAMLSVAATDPVEQEEKVNRRRQQVIDEVVENMRKRPFGALKAEVFKLVLDWTLKFLVVRDDERYLIDRSTYAAKRGFQEIARRLLARGLIAAQREVYFLGRQELYELMRRDSTSALIRARIEGRMRNFDRFLKREANLPLYMQGGKAVDLSPEHEHAADGVFKGIGTSHGKVTGRARVVHDLSEIGRIEHGDILITNHTDPGWTPVFLVIGGIVLETGGMLAHGSLLAREYGFPAVQISDATRRIPEGALVTVDGDTGRLIIESEAATTS